MTTVIRVGIPSKKATLIRGGIHTMLACTLPFPILVEVASIPILDDTRATLLNTRRAEGKSRIGELELDARSVLCDPDVHLAMSLETTYWPKARSEIQSSYRVRGILAEVRAEKGSLQKYYSSFTVPYASTTGGVSNHQSNWAIDVVLRGLIESWSVRSRENGGVLQRLGVSPP